MHITQSNNITVAYATPLITTEKKTTTITQHNALVTRGDLLSTSKYYRYHKALGHTPQHIQHVSDRQKKRLLAESGLPTHMHKQVFLIHDKSVMSKTEIRESKCITNLSHRGPPREDKLMRAPTKQDYIA